jgi:hypothetical protein
MTPHSSSIITVCWAATPAFLTIRQTPACTIPLTCAPDRRTRSHSCGVRGLGARASLTCELTARRRGGERSDRHRLVKSPVELPPGRRGAGPLSPRATLFRWAAGITSGDLTHDFRTDHQS